MAIHDREKRVFASQTVLMTSSGEATPNSPATDDVNMSEADRKLEAMGYKPVSSCHRFS